ncbi:hypothetical protein [Mesorhizobium sp. WSM4887]|uniref:hypothetical protein n=1 Tax=Mesorhizobium sp. WSM4887 TaxID=3038543 RepID=UPI002416343F|nr:hypothetical protein [Mesorhizobium sp. WSM4887]MDG4889707.1 hypothetical protein [Mesorhizobium sp. WSM4887]
MVDSSRRAWVDAVAAGETTDSFVDWWAAREREALAEDDDGPEMIGFSFRIGVTTRAFYEIEFEAESLEKAREHAATINSAEYLAHFPEDFTGDDVKVDLRDEGEPFSWDACEIVKKLAALSGQDLHADGTCRVLRELIANAHRDCNKVTD